MRPGELARIAGVHVETLRYYERSGLLPPPARTASGHRGYGRATVDLLTAIRKARWCGLRIAEIRALFAAMRDDAAWHGALVGALDAALAETTRQIAKLEERRTRLALLGARARGRREAELRTIVRLAWASRRA